MKKLFLGVALCSISGINMDNVLAQNLPPLAPTTRSAPILAPVAPTLPEESVSPDRGFSADRPGFSNTTDVLSRGVSQLETGMSVSVERRPRAVDYHFVGGSPLVRVGIGLGIEARFEGEGFHSWKSESAEGLQHALGISDFSVGLKIKVRKESKLFPELAILPEVSLPVGHVQFSSSSYDQTLKFVWAKTLPGGFSAGGNFNFSRTTDEDRRIIQREFSLSLGHKLPGQLNGYWEVYRVSPLEGASAWMFNTGIAKNVRSMVQIDLEVGRALNPSIPSWFVAAGFAVRLPPQLSWRRGL